MSKVVKNRNSGGDLDAPLRVSPHAIVLRHILHTTICIAALVLGFSISREALLIVVSFRLPYGSFFVKTTTHADGHEVAIISFPRMKQTRAFSGSEFSMSRLTNDQIKMRVPAAKELSLSTLGGNAQVHGFSESKIVIQEHLPSIDSSHLETAPRSSRVHVGRHEILIRPWPHPDPSQTASAQHLMSLVQEEQQKEHGLKERKPLLVITLTSSKTLQLAGLTGLMHTLRLVHSSLTWIVVEAGNESNETAALLANSKLSFHHLHVQDLSGNIQAGLMTEALRYIYDQHLEGIVVFVDESITYNLDFFDKVQKVKWAGAFTASFSNFSGLQGDDTAACEDGQSGVMLVSRPTNALEGVAPLQDLCNSSHEICWYSMRNEFSAGNFSSPGSINWRGFAFNARLLWEDHKVPSIKSLMEFFAGNQSFVQSPVDLVKDSSQIESLGRCGHLVL